MFGKKLYSDKYSFISEICQNAVDSHRMSGQKDPVAIGIKGGKFYVKDTGLSFDSKEDFIEKICTILESGKSEEKTNSEDCAMGMHGIGSISVSAFYPEWKYTVVKNGRKFVATLKEVEGKGLTYEIGDYEKTKEDKYVLFEVFISTNIREFIDNMKNKLCYFKDIMFEFDESVLNTDKRLLTLNSEFKIFQTNDFQISTLSKNTQMHICLDQYFYPINWDRLGITPIQLNIGLKFSLADGLLPDITRENLIYTDDYKEIITKKIREVSEWFVKRYNDSLPDELTSIKRYIEEMDTNKFVPIQDTRYCINSLFPHSTIPIKQLKFKDVGMYVLNRFIIHTGRGRYLYKYTGEISNGNAKVSRSNYHAFTQQEMILVDKSMSTRLSAYIKKEMVGVGLYTKNKISLKRGSYGYVSILGLTSNNKKVWRERIKEMQILEESFERDSFTKASEIVIPNTFSTGPKKVIVRKTSEEVGIKYAKQMSKWSNEWDCKFEEKTLRLDRLYNIPFMHVYGNEEDRKKLDMLYRMSGHSKGNKIAPCMITDRHQSNIKQLNLHNFMHVDDFLAGEHRLLKSTVTSYIINKFITKYNSIFRNKSIIDTYLSSDFAMDMERLEKFRDKYVVGYNTASGAFMDDLVALCLSKKLLDLNIWGTYLKVKDEIDKFDFVEYFVNSGYGSSSIKSEDALVAMKDLAKYRMIKMDWKHYKITVTDEKKSKRVK